MDCSLVPEISLGEWGKQLTASLNGRRHPLSATFEITERCNLKCVHCFINQPGGSRAVRQRELTLEEALSILDQMADLGTFDLLLTGGEILLRKDFPEIYLHAKRKGMLVTLFTNGTLLTRRLADLLAEYPPYLVEITLYGWSPETYERVTQTPRAYSRCRRGIDMLLERGVTLGLKTMVLTINQQELAQIEAFAHERDVPFRYDAMLWQRLDGAAGAQDFRLSPEAVVNLDLADPVRRMNWKAAVEEADGRPVRSERVYSCGGGFYGYHVDAYGRMSLCSMVRNPSFDVRHGNMPAAWGAFSELITAQRTRTAECQDCPVGVLCTQCPGWSQNAFGDNETPVPYVCQVGKLRSRKLIASLAEENRS